jgi:hypothetical protein
MFAARFSGVKHYAPKRRPERSGRESQVGLRRGIALSPKVRLAMVPGICPQVKAVEFRCVLCGERWRPTVEERVRLRALVKRKRPVEIAQIQRVPPSFP